MKPRKPKRPAEILDIEDADELPDESGVEDRFNFNLGDGGRWVPRSPTEDSE
jgi:hypothetical protein